MKRYIFTILIIVFLSNVSFAQNNATNFITEDCNGVMHNLFDSLDAGNVVVIAWVMPCAPCATYAGYAYDAAQFWNVSSGNEEVDFYLVDDYANTSCSNLVAWGNNFDMPLSTTFSSVDISMTDYGSVGMPKVVVLAGSSHTVYYNENDDKISYTGVFSAIENAMMISNINQYPQEKMKLSVSPNPTNEFLNIYYDSWNESFDIRFEIINVLGESVASIYNTDIIDVSFLESGLYFLNVHSKSRKQTIRFVVN